MYIFCRYGFRTDGRNTASRKSSSKRRSLPACCPAATAPWCETSTPEQPGATNPIRTPRPLTDTLRLVFADKAFVRRRFIAVTEIRFSNLPFIRIHLSRFVIMDFNVVLHVVNYVVVQSSLYCFKQIVINNHLFTFYWIIPKFLINYNKKYIN